MSRPDPPLRKLATAVLAGLIALGGVAGVLAPAQVLGDALAPLPGPAPRPRSAGFDVKAVNEGCEGCHSDIAAEWRGSLHQEAWHDPVFQDAYAIEPVAFCRSCHAPEADPASAPSKAAQDVGVGCVSCHMQGGDIVGTRTLAATADAHAVRGDSRLSTREACASCHQFDFPEVSGLPMQNTLVEHRKSKFANVECQSCHMAPAVGSDGKKHRSHDFSVITDPKMIRSAAKVSAVRKGTREIEVTIAADQVGHAFPTGDMFRRLEVRAEAVDEQGNIVASSHPVHLGRRFGDHDVSDGVQGLARVQIADTRVPAGGARTASLRFPSSVEKHSVRWVVAYQRMGSAMAVSFGLDQKLDEVVVAEGTLRTH